MRYLITETYELPFFTDHFDGKNHFVEGMVIYDLHLEKYTDNGVNWHNIDSDHL